MKINGRLCEDSPNTGQECSFEIGQHTVIVCMFTAKEVMDKNITALKLS